MKLFLIRLPMSRQFIVPRNMKLLAVPLSQIHGNAQVYVGSCHSQKVLYVVQGQNSLPNVAPICRFTVQL
jgi:hypothetical protein